jgi:methylated-DNA-protein-cysteine methyltransferase-like protein
VKSFTSFVRSSERAGERAPKTPPRDAEEPRWELIYAVVRRIPRGRVASYGQVAALAGLPRHARQVGYALHALPEGSDVPWHRVINARGEVSPRATPGWDRLQVALLRRERVLGARSHRVDLERFRWDPDAGADAVE